MRWLSVQVREAGDLTGTAMGLTVAQDPSTGTAVFPGRKRAGEPGSLQSPSPGGLLEPGKAVLHILKYYTLKGEQGGKPLERKRLLIICLSMLLSHLVISVKERRSLGEAWLEDSWQMLLAASH